MDDFSYEWGYKVHLPESQLPPTVILSNYILVDGQSFLGIEKRILRQKLRTLEAAQAISSDNSAVGGSSQEGWSRWYLARIWWRDTLPEMARWVATNVGRMASDGCRQIMSTDGIDGYQQINWIPTETWFQSLYCRCNALRYICSGSFPSSLFDKHEFYCWPRWHRLWQRRVLTIATKGIHIHAKLLDVDRFPNNWLQYWVETNACGGWLEVIRWVADIDGMADGWR